MSELERRAGAEIRLHGATLQGRAMVYGRAAQIAPGNREQFQPGAFGPGPLRVPLNLQHDRDIVLAKAGTFDLFDTPENLAIRARLPETSAAIRLVRRKALTGFSVEFRAKRERREADLRVIERAELRGIGLVDRPAYTASRVEVRARMGRTLTAKIPANRKLACDCLRTAAGRAQARWIELQSSVMADLQKDIDDVVASFGSYSRPLASGAKGTLRAKMVGADLEVAIDLPDDANGRAVLSAHESAGIVARPFIDSETAEFEIIGDTAVYSKAPLRAVIISATDRREGWPEPVIGPTPEGLIDDRALAGYRRMLAWL